MSIQCSYQNQAGNRCRAFCVSGDNYCFSHSPKFRNEKAKAVMKGGMASKKKCTKLDPVSLKTTQDVLILLCETINAVRTLDISNQAANTIGYLSGYLLKAFESVKIEQKLCELEAKMEDYYFGFDMDIKKEKKI